MASSEAYMQYDNIRVADYGSVFVDDEVIMWRGHMETFDIPWTGVRAWGVDQRGVAKGKHRFWVVTHDPTRVRFDLDEGREQGSAFAGDVRAQAPFDSA